MVAPEGFDGATIRSPIFTWEYKSTKLGFGDEQTFSGEWCGQMGLLFVLWFTPHIYSNLSYGGAYS